MPIPSMPTRRTALLLAMVISLSACAVMPSPSVRPGGSVAIVVAADGIDIDLSRARMTGLLEKAGADAGKPAFVPVSVVSLSLGEAVLTGIGDEFAVHGALSPTSREQLLSMPVPVDRALLVRLVRNDTELLEPRSEPALGADGRRLDDRDMVVLSQRRLMRVSAVLIDLQTGAPRWQRAWDAGPVSSLRYVNYSGSSLAASVAATLANTVVSGLQGPSAPPAVGELETLQALFAEVMGALPER